MTAKTRKKQSELTPEERLIHVHEKEMKLFLKMHETDVGPADSRLPERDERYIMQVIGYAKFPSSDYKSRGTSAKLINQMVVRLDGVPTPSSPKVFDMAYLCFIEEDKDLRKPEVIQRGGRYVLYIYYPFGYLATIERMLESAVRCYAWIGNFTNANGDVNYFAEVHAGYVRPKLV